MSWFRQSCIEVPYYCLKVKDLIGARKEGWGSGGVVQKRH